MAPRGGAPVVHRLVQRNEVVHLTRTVKRGCIFVRAVPGIFFLIAEEDHLGLATRIDTGLESSEKEAVDLFEAPRDVTAGASTRVGHDLEVR